MSKELARSARALGRDMNFFGSKEKDFVIQTKGRVKINFGDKFIELFNGSKFTVGNSDAIKTTNGEPSSTDSDGFYFDENTGTLYLKIGDKVWAGNVEIHRTSDDWLKHNHQEDKNYNSVILHVVEKANCEVHNQQGQPVVQCEIIYPKHIIHPFQQNAALIIIILFAALNIVKTSM